MKIMMPQIGMTMQEGTISRWLVSDGETIEKGQPMVEITTEKLENEVEAPASGILIHVAAEDDIIPCGEAIAEIQE